MKENTQKGQRYWGAGEVNRGEEENIRLKKKKKEKKESRRGKPWIKLTLCYCATNLHKLVHKAPLCVRVLASYI